MNRTGAKIYTIGIFNGANVSGTDESNIFMNYVSSNYPKAYGYTETDYVFIFPVTFPVTSYKLAPGEEPYNTGYYMTADDADGLNNIFEVISSQIGKPNVELGSSATLIDVVSNYFTIEGLGESPNITAQTANYLGNGSWATPVNDSNIGTILTGTDTITVNGFDFDNNYISETARDGFYGKKLVLTFYTLPEYEKIDAAGSFADAKISTNDVAALLDSEGNAVDYIPSPTLTANKVAYVADGSKVAEYYRLPGSTVTVLDKPAETAEKTYSEWSTTDVTLSGNTFTMPAQDVTLTSTGTAKDYTVYYTYKGNVPEGAAPAAAPEAGTYTVGAEVTLPTVTAPAGYEFSGWTEDGGDAVPGEDGTFHMPAEDLHFEGYFIALASSYTVEHYLMDTEGNYPSTADHENVYDGVKTGDTVTATTPDHTGYSYDVTATTDAANADENVTMTTVDGVSVPTGSVLADGALTLKVYYKRNTHTVTYHYDGDVPKGADPAASQLDELKQVDVYYGAEVTIAKDAAADGYTFTGWRVYTGDTTIADGKMIMPDKDVVLYGSFTAKGDTPYTIEHYFENLNDDGYTLNEDLTSDRTGQTDTTAYAEPLSGADIAGFTYDEGNPENVVSGNIEGDGSLVLKLYYNRTRHKVTYEYTGNVPEGADPVPAAVEGVKYGAEVNIAAPAAAEGHEFVGWTIVGSDISVNDNKFAMPARDVVLTGHFNPISSQYTVEHYLEDADGEYVLAADPTVHTVGIHVGNVVTGIPNTYNTYTYDSVKTAAENGAMTNGTPSVPTGTVTADGNLVLKLYYTRNAYDITYRFENNPANVTLPAGHEDVKHGTVVDLADITAPAGYTFDGWYYGTEKVGGSLTMPTADVELVGRFTANSGIPYTVKYFLQDVDGEGYTEDTSSAYTRTGTTGDYVVADSREYPGFSFDTKQGAWNGHIKGDGSLVLELYYNRNSYTVSYYYFGTPPTDAGIYMDGAELTLTEENALIVSETVLYGAEKTVKSHLTTDNAAYEFRGWYTANLLGFASNEIAAGTAYTMPAHNVEFRGALYDYTVYYNLNGGQMNGADTVDPKSVNWDDAGLLPDGTPEKSGMIFTGWTYSQKTVSDTDKYSEIAGSPIVAFIVLDANYADGYTVTYDWGTENIPDNVTLPTDSGLYAEGDSYTVDTTYTSSTVVEEKNAFGNVTGRWTFSGWTDPNNGVMGNTNVTISGSWTYKPVSTPVVPPVDSDGNAKLKKVDAEDNTTVLSGVVFELYRANGTYVDTYTTDRNGEIKVFDLDAGTYYWRETRAAAGYALDNSKYTFTVSAGKTASVVIENSKSKVPTAFIDDHYAYIIGYDDGLVHPEANITRAEVATIFFRLLNEETRDQYLTRENSFSDVSKGDWYNTAVSTMAAMGIVTGRPGNVFDPNANITRAEFAAIAARFDAHGNAADASFSDIYDHWAKREINIAANNGWVLGYEDGTFKPDQNITRAEAVTMVNRVLQRIPETVDDLHPDMVVWPDNMDTRKWYYLMVQEATNSHYYARKTNGYEYWTGLREVPDWTVYER